MGVGTSTPGKGLNRPIREVKRMGFCLCGKRLTSGRIRAMATRNVVWVFRTL